MTQYNVLDNSSGALFAGWLWVRVVLSPFRVLYKIWTDFGLLYGTGCWGKLS